MSNVDVVKKILSENWSSVFSMLLGKEPEISVQDVSDCTRLAAAEGVKGLPVLVRLAYGEAARQRMLIATSPKLVSIVANLMMGLTTFKEQISNDDRDAFKEAVSQMFAACQVPFKEQLRSEVKFAAPGFIQTNEFAATFVDDSLRLWKCFIKIPAIATERFFLITPADFVPAAAAAPVADKAREVPLSSAGARPLESGGSNLDLLLDVELPITVRIGSTEMKLLDIMKLGIGSIIELEKLVDDPVDVLVNERLVARGEVVVYDSNFAIRITDVESRENRIRSLGG